ncbi:MAG TPA: hypothetical protein VFO78_08470 [Candidatus Limnocylindrales bacterium]|nr:hypothetical protein [Candidatus Limnocylindrales bacterium]
MSRVIGIRRAGLAASTALLLLGAVAAPVAAHSQTVQPPSKDAPVVSGPISNAWAQAHCNAASPSLVADRSNGVVSFLPAGTLPCPAVPNPGGHVHGD